MIAKAKPFVWLFLVAILTTSCYKEPEFRGLDKIVVKELTADGITVDADGVFYNPNGISITLREIDVDLVINEKAVGKLNYELDQKIEGKKEFILPFTVSFPPKLLFDNLLQGLFGMVTKKEYKVEYTGHVRAKAAGITFKIPVNAKKTIKF